MWWGMIARVLEKTGSKVRSHGMMYKALAQSVLLYVSESWVATGVMLKVLEGFHYRVARRIMGMTATCGAGGEWEYPPVMAVLEAVGLHPIMDYIRSQKATIAGKLKCRPIYEICVKAERRPGKIWGVIW